jgi:hypothetical protein
MIEDKLRSSVKWQWSLRKRRKTNEGEENKIKKDNSVG